jgi:hypothetical protein
MDVLTTKEANLGKLAHIVGASPDGPRGDLIESPRMAKDPSNLMLLCGPHHDLVDSKKNEAVYPKEILREYKQRHELRIERLTRIAENQKSVPLLIEIPVGAHELRTPADELTIAMAAEDLYPDNARKIHVDLNGMTGRDHDAGFWEEARHRLASTLAQRLSGAEHDGSLGHVSIFAFGPMPLLIFAGHLLDDKMVAREFNRIRDPQGWRWPKDTRRIDRFVVTPPTSSLPDQEVALVLSVTSQVQREHMKQCVPETMPVFELTWSTPSLDCLRAPDELAEFVGGARDIMERIHRARPPRVHVFPAVPVAAALAFGRCLQKKLHPPLMLYDFHQGSGGWRQAFEITARTT